MEAGIAGWIVAGCTAFTFLGGGVVWVARHWVLDLVEERRKKKNPAPQIAETTITYEQLRMALTTVVTAEQLKAALLEFGVLQLEKFNGRYPSREVFTSEMRRIDSSLSNITDYIGRVSDKIDAALPPHQIEHHRT